MPRWDELFDRVRTLEAERLELERRKREAEEARRAADAWADQVLPRVWQALLDEVERRVGEFALKTGKRIKVTARDHFTWTARPGAIRVIELQLDESVVYLYSHRAPGALPLFHIASWISKRSGHRNANRVMSVPLCRVEKGTSGEFRMRRSAPHPPDPIEPEDVVFRAFELLVYGLGRPDARLAALAVARPDREREPEPSITRRMFESN